MKNWIGHVMMMKNGGIANTELAVLGKGRYPKRRPQKRWSIEWNKHKKESAISALSVEIIIQKKV